MLAWRRQHVHALRAGGARRGFERKAGQPGAGQPLQAGRVERIEHADQRSAGLHQRQFGVGRSAHLEHQVAAEGARRHR